jgi:DNA invertase Pin-like site-specific DNA recombinase
MAVEKRKLGALLKKLNKGDILISSEISRLGRNLMMIMSILNICMQKGIHVWTIKDNYRLGNDINSKVLAFAFGLSAEIERNLISQRTKEALNRKRAEGVILGRRHGSKNKFPNKKCLNKIDKINKLLEKGCSIAKIAKIVRVSRGTLYRFLFRTKNELFIKRQNEIYGQTNENSIYGYTRICGGTIEKIG